MEYGTAIARLHNAFLDLEKQILCDPANVFETVQKWALPDVKKQTQQWSLNIPVIFL